MELNEYGSQEVTITVPLGELAAIMIAAEAFCDNQDNQKNMPAAHEVVSKAVAKIKAISGMKH